MRQPDDMAIKNSSIEGRLTIALSITLLVLVAEAVGGLLSNSLALMSDAGHVLTDAFALGLSLMAAVISRRPLDTAATYGYHRATLIAATVNGLSLIAVAGFIFYESFGRLMSPPEVNLSLMMPVAAAGLAANVAMVLVLGSGQRGHAHSGGDLNLHSAWLHVMGDTLASVGVLASGAVIYYTGWRLADPLMGLLIGCVIVVGGSRVLWASVQILIDMVPPEMDLHEVMHAVRMVDGVRDVHHVHLRSMSRGMHSFSAHVCVQDMMLSRAGEVRSRVEAALASMGIAHVMIQMEACEPDAETGCDPCPTERLPFGHAGHEGHGH